MFLFDNASDQSNVSRIITELSPWPTILITSRLSPIYWSSDFNFINLNVFTEEEAKKFWKTNINESELENKERVISEILRELSYHPLALHQAVCYLKNPPIAPVVDSERYHQLLANRKRELKKTELMKYKTK